MKISLYSAILFCSAGLPLFAAPDSAYQALRVVGNERGKDVLKHVVEVEGHGGVPQPVVWRVVIDDPSARGGIRELDVAHGKIVAEHTPVVTSDVPTQRPLIDMTKLNLDSPGAFAVVEKEAQRARIGFDSVDYSLQNGDPEWMVNIMDGSGHRVGSMTVAASSGDIIANNLGGAAAPSVETTPAPDYTAQDTDHDNVYSNPDDSPPQRQADDTDTEDTHGLRLGHRIKTAILSAGHSLKNFVTGGDSGN
jgi:hypothetical protein